MKKYSYEAYVKFYLVSNPTVMKEYHQKDGSILVLKTFDEKEANFADSLTKENLKKFVQRSTTPLVTEFNQENAAKIFSSDIVKHFLMLSSKDDKEHDSRIEDVCIICQYVFYTYFFHILVESCIKAKSRKDDFCPFRCI